FEGENLLHQSGTFFSGFESSSTVAAFTLLELSRSTKYQELARIDILRAIEKNGWIYESFNDMKFLDQCIAESVRLHPPVSTVDRQAKEDYKIPGTEVIIEKGTAIYISLYGLHRDPKYFDNPDEFDPNRFNGKALPDAYIPYGAGPRMCVGVKAGQLHAKVTVAMILSQYEIYQSENVVTELDSRSTFTAACDGIRMEFRKI
ncbi:cytochrome P450 6k1-like, partial [Hyposmocoma kahamanoa]|uniref:cytochrome P450 6k1-like n=1 Tax=Hyposmocoma kahamanoa TaxID=1477025 RepID=UPI000E6D6BC4